MTKQTFNDLETPSCLPIGRREVQLFVLLASCGLACSSNDSSASDGGAIDGGAIDGGVVVDGDGTVIPQYDASPTALDASLDDATEVCARWNADRTDLSNGTWSGAVNGCDAGDTTAAGRANALRQVNLYRWLADLPAVTTDPTKDARAQECALMMQANTQLSHAPPTNWTCYSASGASGAGKSNIATTAGVSAVALYMGDNGNATTMGHRRWILSNGLGPIGLGSAIGYSCMEVIGGSGGGGNAWTAYPPEGVVPIEAMLGQVDSTGWTIQSSSIGDLNDAAVTITTGGVDKPVTVVALSANYGSAQAIKITPSGWSSEAGKSYTVNVSGIAVPFSYNVQFVSCN